MERLKSMIACKDFGGAWSRLLILFQQCHDYVTVTNLCRHAATLERSAGPPAHLVPLRIALLSGATTDMLVQPLRLALIACGVQPEMHVGGYNQFVSEMLDPAGALHSFVPRVTVIVNTPFNVPAWPSIDAKLEAVESLVDQACAGLLEPCRHLHDRVGCDILLNTLHPPPSRPAGNLGAKLPGDATNFIRRINVALGDRVPAFVHLSDVAALVERRGLDEWFDPRYWFHAKQPCSFTAVADYVRNTAAIVGAIVGRTRKCLVLDLDDTLWGGVVGDDGVEGIELGEGTASGEAFKAFQTYLRDLRDRGVLLAVCSKNDEKIARSAFTDHPEMVLRLDDFVAFVANWAPKSDNIRAIARQLDLGLDAFVFVDDNPAEREQVRQALPPVAVPELPDDPSEYPRAIDSARYFEVASLTLEDVGRTDTYKRRQAAADAMGEATDLTSYLASLEMKAVIQPFDDVSLERITQLTNKTNQFNLTTRRVTLSEMKAMAADPTYLTRTVRLCDRFGDHGLISVFFAKVADRVMTIEGWLMSCRVLKRGVERALLGDVLEAARRLGVTELIGLYKPTERNGLVKDLYKDLGFTSAGETADDTRWRLRVDDAPDYQSGIEVETAK